MQAYEEAKRMLNAGKIPGPVLFKDLKISELTALKEASCLHGIAMRLVSEGGEAVVRFDKYAGT